MLNIIKDTKINSSKSSAGFYLDALELKLATMKKDSKTLDDGVYPITKTGDLCIGTLEKNRTCVGEKIILELTGEKPTAGMITIKNGKVEKISGLQYGSNYFVLNNKTGNIESPDKWDGKTATALSNIEYNDSTKTYKIKSAADLAGILAFAAGTGEGYVGSHGHDVTVN